MATEYIILRHFGKSGDGDMWVKLEGTATAASARTAIRDAVDKSSNGGEFVAVPARSWNPVKVQVEQALKFS